MSLTVRRVRVGRAAPGAAGEATPRHRVRIPLRLVLRLTAVAAVALALHAGWTWVRTTPSLSVREVEVVGARLCDAARVAAATGAVGRNVVALDLEAARLRVLREPWVRQARVHRSLPGSVRVVVEEHAPTALLAGDAGWSVLDEAGRVVESGVARERFPLPVLELDAEDVSPRVQAARAAATLAALRRELPGHAALVERLVAAEGGSLVLHAQGHPPVWLSGPDSLDELAAWLDHAGELRLRLGAIASVDARWRDRLFVTPSSDEVPLKRRS